MRHQAIIIKKQPLREDDELVMCYTREAGKQRYVAKSSMLASSKQGSHLDVLNHIEFNLIEGKHHPIIASAHAINTFPEIKALLPKLAEAFFILECFDKLVYENERDDGLWEFLLEKFTHPEQKSSEREILDVMGHAASVRFSDLAKHGTIALWKISP